MGTAGDVQSAFPFLWFSAVPPMAIARTAGANNSLPDPRGGMPRPPCYPCGGQAYLQEDDRRAVLR